MATGYAGDDRSVRLQLAALQKQVTVLRAALARQLEISGRERLAKELAVRSRDEALRQCVRTHLPPLAPR